MHFHWQNLNDAKRDLLNGRAWCHFGAEYRGYSGQKTVQVAWRLGPWQWIGLMFTRAAEEVDYGLSVGLGFASLFIELSGFRGFQAMRRCVFGFDTGIRLQDSFLIVRWNNDDSETRYSYEGGKRVIRDAHGWSRSWELKDVLLGRAEHSSAALGYGRAFIVMPEATYACSVALHRDRWKRSRWPWPLVIERATVEIAQGIPIPGKGKNSWDCGEDKIYSSTMPARSVEEALQKVRDAAMERREKYGGPHWLPEGLRFPCGCRNYDPAKRLVLGAPSTVCDAHAKEIRDTGGVVPGERRVEK